MGDKTYLQLNVSNVFDKLYYGGFDGRLDAGFAAASNLPFVQIGSPRTFIGSVVFAFYAAILVAEKERARRNPCPFSFQAAVQPVALDYAAAGGDAVAVAAGGGVGI